jgi:outer membrane protein OmpA-like peptidoglycan-associated protein
MAGPARLLLLLAASAALGGCVLPGPALYLTGEQQELEQAMAGTPVQVVRKGDAVLLRMPNDVTFAVDRAEVASAFAPVLDAMAEVIARYPETEVRVTGHADSTGTEAHNQALSERRAASVGAALAAKGVARARLAMNGEGENAPIASNETEEGRAENRRVEVVVQPLRLAEAAPTP